MFVARFSFNVRYGHKDDVLQIHRRWTDKVGAQLGWKQRLLVGSVGDESRVESEITIGSLAELEKSFEKLATMDEHKRFAKELEPHIVSGTNRWEILRLADK
jgi:hypothetical protein